jgi:hypothetical protein
MFCKTVGRNGQDPIWLANVLNLFGCSVKSELVGGVRLDNDLTMKGTMVATNGAEA